MLNLHVFHYYLQNMNHYENYRNYQSAPPLDLKSERYCGSIRRTTSCVAKSFRHPHDAASFLQSQKIIFKSSFGATIFSF